MLKKTLLINACAFMFCIMMFSCRKNETLNTTKTQDEILYKGKVENLLHSNFTATTGQDASKGNVLHLRFKTFQEVYNYFKFLESNTQFRHTDTAMLTINAGKKGIISSMASQASSPVYNYYGDFKVSTTASESFGIASVLLTYHLFYQIQWLTVSGGEASILSNQPTNGMFFYSGLGTASGTPGITPGSSGTGTISGGMQGTATVSGASVTYTTSFFISLSGSYLFNVPAVPGGVSVVTTYLSATSS